MTMRCTWKPNKQEKESPSICEEQLRWNFAEGDIWVHNRDLIDLLVKIHKQEYKLDEFLEQLISSYKQAFKSHHDPKAQ